MALTCKEYNHLKMASNIRERLTTFRAVSWPEQLQWIETDTTSSYKSVDAAAPYPMRRHQTAFLQFTSGSTSTPKGVQLTHGNLAHNLHIITTELEATDDTIVVSWLPQYHDMGLIGSFLGVLYCGGSGYYFSPLHFLQRPSDWLRYVSHYKATHLQAPNFAFALTARKMEQQHKLDLSTVRHVINAAEPVTVESMEAFYQATKPFGFPDNVIFPTYGLAEHTVFVCTNGRKRLSVKKELLEVEGKVELADGDHAATLVGCGYPPDSVDLRIVDPQTSQERPEKVVGEIWLHSPSKAAGYYNMPEESARDFEAKIEGSDRGYLRTGDLGFVYENELFICGRLKDLIIVGGRNYYPQDIEATAEAVSDMFRLGCTAAFTIDTNRGQGEEGALIMEIKESSTPTQTCEDLINKVRAYVNQEHSLALAEIILIKPKTVPKTSSGKIARAWCRKAFIANSLQVVHRKSFRVNNEGTLSFETEGQPKTANDTNRITSEQDFALLRSMSKAEILAKLQSDVDKVAGPVSVDKTTPLVNFMDSVTLSQFKGMLENSYDVKLSDEYLFRESTTLQKLVEVVKLGYAPDDCRDGDARPAPPPQAPTAGGLAGALGCPPGVRCTIL
jgi:acyl-CoA synthetase (AMP-forming)/AMP-acid ligase II